MDVNAATFEAEVVERSHELPVVVDFWAPWCTPCLSMAPVLDRLQSESAGAWRLAKLDIDENESVSRAFGVQSIPTLKAFVNGEVVAELVGARPPQQIREWLDGFVTDPVAALLEDAASLQDREAVRQRLEEALALRHDHPDALLALAEHEAGEGGLNQARALLARIPGRVPDAQHLRRIQLEIRCDGEGGTPKRHEEPVDLATAYRDAHALAVEEDWDGALATLLGIVMKDRMFREDGGRRGMLRIFDVVGPLSPTAERWRARLAEVLAPR
ncbi:MAG: tetratricopeptide repeat protein [Myxococcota bacterium]